MSDSRKEFENWYSGAFSTKPKFTMVSPNHYKDDDVDAAYWAWKACQKVNDARITSLESHNRELLAVNQVLREALNAAQAALDTYDYTGTKEDSDKYIKAERLCAEAIAFNPGDMKLVEVNHIDDFYIDHFGDFQWNNIYYDAKLYTIQTKRNTEGS